MSAINFLNNPIKLEQKSALKPQKIVKYNKLDEQKKYKATKSIIAFSVYLSSLNHELNKLVNLKLLNADNFYDNASKYLKSIEVSFEEMLKKDSKENLEKYLNKRRAIEEIVFMLIENDDLIFRTEKFVTTIKK